MDDLTPNEEIAKKKKPPVILLTILAAIMLAVIVVLFIAPNGEEKPISETIKATPVQTEAAAKADQQAIQYESTEATPAHEDLVSSDTVEEEEEIEVEEIRTEEIGASEETDVEIKKPVYAQEEEEVEQVELQEYRIEKGDSLWKIAGRDEVLDDSQSWWYLLKSNKNIVKSTYRKDGKWYAVIPAGETLKIPTQDEIEKMDKEEKNTLLYPWAVQVYSGRSHQEVENLSDKLNKKGYAAYVTSVTLNNEEWHRLRIGFFPTKDEAEKVGKRVLADFQLASFWAVLPSKGEITAHFGP